MNKYRLSISLLLFSFLIPTDREPTVALVLSGGAAKGYAHIPVLEMIDSLDINIDMIVGTSIGANVGALYATGYNSQEIQNYASQTDWISIFLEETDRYDMSYFHKKDESKYQIDFDLNGFTPSLPSSAIHGQRAYLELSKLLGHYEYINNFENFYIPFYCNASDLITGEDILLSDGSIVTAIRSTTSIPSVFSPVDYKGYLLVDGGVTNNIPANIAKTLGADIIFTVTVASSKPGKDQIKSSIFDILGESVFIHTSDLIKENLKLSDYSLSIKMPKGTSANFTKKGLQTIYEIGKKNVYTNIDLFLDLKKQAGGKKERNNLKKLDDLNLKVKTIEIIGNERFNDNFIADHLGININDTLELDLIHNGINNLYGLGYFNIVRYSLEPESDLKETKLTIFVEESNFNKLQTGLRWDNYHELIAVANIKTNDIIFPGLLIKNEFQFPGIMKNTFEISYPRTLFSNPYYPFYRNLYYKKNVDYYNDDGEREVEYETRIINHSLGAGFVVGKNLGVEFALNYELSNLTGFPVQESLLDYENELTKSSSLVIDYDSRDDALLTRNGILANLKLLNSEYNNLNYQSTIFDFDIYKTWGRNTFRFNFLSRIIGDEALFNNTLFQGESNRAIGYQPYFLTSNQLEMTGLEWMYHYKSMYFRLFYSEISELSQNQNNFILEENLISYGWGLAFKSPFGPLELIWGKGPKKLMDSSDKQTIFHVNIGYKF